ncbi:MAG: hypothetical protein RL272_729 [Candidatus Parcubacteria bacterium]
MTNRPKGSTDFGHHVRRAGRTGFFWKTAGRAGGGPRMPAGSPLKKILSWVAVIGISGFFAATVAAVGLFAWVSKELPDPNNINQRNIAETTKIYDRTGQHILYEIHGDQKRTIVDLSDMSDYVKKATISAEDRNFYSHSGFDVRGMIRGLFRNIFNRGGKLQSGSTITQQFIKKSVLSDEQTYTRKVKELILAIEIERRFTKDQILKLYLNEIPYGSVAYGIESASQTFFGKSAKELTLSESALLAALPKGPTYYSPYGNHREELIARQHYILDGMVEEGYVPRDDAEAAKKDDVLARIQPKRESITAPHFVFYVKEQLANEFGEQVVERGGLKVITTLDIDKQKMAEQAIADHRKDIQAWKANTAAMTAIDPSTGEIIAMVGSADYFDETINGKYNAILGRLQPGSSIKPIVYAAAFEKGYSPTTVVEDIKTDFSTTSVPYAPNDYDGKERGFVTLKEALAGSLNIPAVKVLYLTGLDRFQDFASRLGYTTFADKSRFGLSLVLGGAEVHPLEHIAAFSAFAQDGIWRPTKAVLKVEDKDGNVLKDESGKNPGKRVFDKEIARQINSILTDNSARAYIFGENNFLTLPDRPVAAKTGTTNDYKDAWAVGYTPSLVTGVWVGDANGGKMKQGADGSKVAAPIWNQFMRKALAGSPAESFEAPAPFTTGKPVLDGEKSSQVTVKVDRFTGKIATEFTPPDFVEERHYGVPHSILFFVDKNDPRGAAPERPENDPQFSNWEKPVAAWAEAQHLVITPPPTEKDDVHVPENVPVVSFFSPTDGSAITERSFQPSVSATSRRGVVRVEFLIDGEFIGESAPPFNSRISIPNHFTKGFRMLTAKAYDDVGNSAETSITVNVTAEPGPLGIQWTAPYASQSLNAGDFPFTVRFRIEDPSSIQSIRMTVKDEDGMTEQLIGSVDRPALPNMSVNWTVPPLAGRYLLTVDATLQSGDVRTESIPVSVR